MIRKSFLLSWILTLPLSLPGVTVTTHHNDTSRTGANPNETVLTTANVNSGSFGKLFSRAVDGQIYAQPLYVPGVTIPGKGTHNVIYVCTMHNSVYAFDADTASASAPLWQVNFGATLPVDIINVTRDIEKEVGILSTPVIDLTTNLMYVVSEHYQNEITFFRLHALDITTGNEMLGGPVTIEGSVAGTSTDSVKGILSFFPLMQWQRAGLLLLNGKIYIGFGSHMDTEPYHGWLFAYSASTLQQTAVLCLSPNSMSAGLWQGGLGLTADSAGNIYLQTDRGVMDSLSGGPDHGSSLVKISTSNGMQVVDYFSPTNQEALSANDIDFGSSGPILIPGTSLGITGGKDGKLFLFNTNGLGGYSPTTNQVPQWWQATYSLLDTGEGGIFGGNVFYNSKLYLWGRRDALKVFQFNGSVFNTTPVSQSTFTVPNGYSNEPAMSLSANGTTAGSAILWASYSMNGRANGSAYPGILRAFDATDVTRELWNSEQISARDAAGSWAKWCPPTIAEGRVYLATFDGVLNVYGLLGGNATASITVAAGSAQHAAVNATFAIPFQALVRDNNNNPVAGAMVTFAAPSSGPGGTFSGSLSASAVTNSNGIATAPTFTANSQTGTYAISAAAPGVSTPAVFNLTNDPPSTNNPILVTIQTLPSALSVQVDGVTFTTPHTFEWGSGSSHVVTAPPVQGAGGTRYTFSSWSDGGAASHTVVASTGTSTFTAAMLTQYKLSTSVSGGTGSINANPASADGFYNAGTEVQLTAAPATGFRLISWGGDAAGSTSMVNVPMSGPKNVTALFGPDVPCASFLAETYTTVASSGDIRDVEVTSPPGCLWQSNSTVAWISILSGATGEGKEAVRIRVNPNPEDEARAATIYLAGVPYTIGQAASGCGFSLAGPSQTLGSSGGTYQLTITGPAGCDWSASAAPSWIKLNSTTAGTGNGTLTFSADTNRTGQPRTGYISMGGQLWPLIQQQLGPVPPFGDVPPGYLFFDSISLLKLNNITTGCGGGNYCPEAGMTRSEMAAFLVRAVAGEGFTFSNQPYFTDVPATHPYFSYIQKLRELGVTNGCSATQFCPDDTVTRGQMAAFLIRARLGITFNETFPFEPQRMFTDVDASNVFYPYVQKMKELGITSGCTATTYCANDLNTRGQMAAFLIRAFFTP
ncbi:MAG: S-layer homology domain-containing protein [Bryobacterales bacterium]|nr:S-layer homology domain-containing protein [Bryobacterales bacterium]